MSKEQQYCISARDRNSGYTESITGPMNLDEAKSWRPTSTNKRYYKYFRVSKYPFKNHKK